MQTQFTWHLLKKVNDCIQPEKRDIWEKTRENDCRDSFKADAKSNFFPQTCCKINRKQDKREPGFLKRNLEAPKNYVFVAKLIAAMTTHQANSNLAAND